MIGKNVSGKYNYCFPKIVSRHCNYYFYFIFSSRSIGNKVWISVKQRSKLPLIFNNLIILSKLIILHYAKSDILTVMVNNLSIVIIVELFLDEPSTHGHLVCKSLKVNGLPIIQGTNGFEVESVSSHAIQVKQTSSSPVTLLSPYRVFKDVHNASVSIMIIHSKTEFILSIIFLTFR